MPHQLHVSLALCAAALLIACARPSRAADDNAYKVYSHSEARSFDQMIEALSKADVVVVGEEHDHKLGHGLELEILKGLHARRPSMVLSLEMFERDVQLVLDEYLSDEISSASFLAAARPWPNYPTDYAPMVEFCKANKLPVVAANAPQRYVSTASRKGQGALLELPKASKEYLAKLPYSMDLPEGYDKALTEIFSTHGDTGGTAGPPQPAHMKDGQALWDATMADSVAKAHARFRNRLIMEVNGAMHSDSGWGLVDRLRKQSPHLKVMIVSIKPDESYPNVSPGKYDSVADYVIVTAPVPEKPTDR